MIKNMLFIDPSTRALGWSVFRVSTSLRSARLVRSGVVRLRSKGGDRKDWIDRVDQMVAAVGEVRAKYGVGGVVAIELPGVFHSARGRRAARAGSILKLMAVVFAIRQASFPAEVVLVPVMKWKGTVPKHITQARIRSHWKWRGSDHNEADAVGIGDWYIRKHLKYRAVKGR